MSAIATHKTIAAEWPDGPARPILAPDAVHVWSMGLDPEREMLPGLERHLSPEERERADRFAFATDRARFVAGHAMLRSILAAHLDMAPSEMRFRANEFGKPSVAGHDGNDALHFNFSRSHGLALCAVTRGRTLGVDVERILPLSGAEEIAERFFSPRELAALLALPVEQRCNAFYACWSRKEAYIKARGLGFSLMLDSFDVSLAPGEPAALLAVRGGEAEGAVRWTLHGLSPLSGYAAAVAVEGESRVVSCHHWPAARAIQLGAGVRS